MKNSDHPSSMTAKDANRAAARIRDVLASADLLCNEIDRCAELLSTLKFAAPLVQTLEDLREMAGEVVSELEDFDVEDDDEIAMAKEAIESLLEDRDAVDDLLGSLAVSLFHGLNPVKADDMLLEDLESFIERQLQPVRNAAAGLRASLAAAQ